MALKASPVWATLLLFLAIFPNNILSEQGLKPFEFLQHLEGCQKGQTVKGVNELKQYLRKFGYLTSANIDSSDEFDELLESGIKTYQLNYDLNITGTLDSQTTKEMMIPRCGVPDILGNGGTSMRSGENNKKHRHHRKHLHTVSHYGAFYPGNLRWPKTQLTYTFSSSSLPVIDTQILRSVCSNAFSTWAAVTGFSFVEVAGQADIVIGFYRGDHGDGASFDGPGGIIAHATAPTNGMFHYDADENWSTNPGSNMIDLESVAVHEIGHLLGLRHSLEANSVMNPKIPPGTIKRKLDGDDIEGIRALYGL